MPNLFSLVIIGAIGWLLYRTLAHGGGGQSRPDVPPPPDKNRTRDITPLEKDPKTGIYRPRDE